jgi:phosphate transport system substrate-binding protein
MSMASSVRSRLTRSGQTVFVAVVAVVITIPAAVVTQAIAAPSASSAGTQLLGGGSSYAAPALTVWTQQIAAINGDNIFYGSTSSVLGLNQYAQGQLNFAASEIGYSTGQAASTPQPPQAPYQYLPDVAGATCFEYNLPSATGVQITNLQLDEPVLLKIFTGQILLWNDPAIQALNPGVALPSTSIIKAFRSDAAGENYILSDYFTTLDASGWNGFTTAMGTPSGAQAIFPTPSDGQGGPHGIYDITGFFGAGGSDVASAYVSDNVNSITYVETSYALSAHLPCAAILNPAGKFVQPSVVADAVALTKDQLQPDLEQILTGVFTNPDPASYPISAYSYLITQENGQPSPGVGAVLGRFVQFIACLGQQSAELKGYSPIPPNLVADDFAAVNRINGAATLPPPTGANCANPYLTGALSLPGEPIQIGTPGGGAPSSSPTASSGTVGTNGTSSPAATAAGSTSGGGSSSSSSSSSSSGSSAVSPSQAAAVAAAAASASRVAAALQKKGAASGGQIPGIAEVLAAQRLLHLDGPTSKILFWTLLLVLVFAVIPFGIAALGKRRRRGGPNPTPEVGP